MTLIYKLVGFDRETEALAVEYLIPRAKTRRAKTIAGIADDPAIFADWPLSRDQAAALADLIGAKIDSARYDWEFEPYAAAAPPDCAGD
jgi:hypothetical protein